MSATRDLPPVGTESPRRVLLVEDDAVIAREVLLELNGRGFAVSHVATGPAGLDQAMGGGFDVLVLDRLLPDDWRSGAADEPERVPSDTAPVTTLPARTARRTGRGRAAQ